MDIDVYNFLEKTIYVPKQPYSKQQLNILKRIIKQKHITREYFYDMLFYVFNCKSINELDYQKMYRLINVLNKIDINDKNN